MPVLKRRAMRNAILKMKKPAAAPRPSKTLFSPAVPRNRLTNQLGVRAESSGRLQISEIQYILSFARWIGTAQECRLHQQPNFVFEAAKPKFLHNETTLVMS
jgi:hypothetical protein